MARNAVTDWSETAGDNTDVGGINIAENCPPGNVNNALREIMAQVAGYVDGLETQVDTKAGASYTAVVDDRHHVLRFTRVAGATLDLTDAATLGNGWSCIVWANSGTVTIDPDGSEEVNGETSLVLQAGSSAILFCTGDDFLALVTMAHSDVSNITEISQSDYDDLTTPDANTLYAVTS